MTIVEKIKALLAKAASTTNPHEAEIFLAKAHELMEKHQLQSEDLEHDDPVGAEDFYKKGSTKAAPDWDFNIIWPLAEYFGCKACRMSSDGKWVMDLVGRESARITTVEMHKYLVATVRRLGREAVGTPDFAIRDEDGYPVGYMNADQCARRIGNALRARLAEMNRANKKPEPETASGKNALITLDRVATLYDERHPNTTNVSRTYYTNSGARKLAASIGLNLQTTGGAGQRALR